ncbi:hypothetical protein ABZN20_10285 [Methylococcus sp. ANG]|uniref:hypothetical protein n=1 Tax=Methylococcus sp. ANG TaxID=3231903 RepID=UPI00345754A2
MIDHPNASNQKSCVVAVPRQRNCATSAQHGATHVATNAQPHTTNTGTDVAQFHEDEPNDKGCSDIKALASAVLERNKSRNHSATYAEKQRNFPPPKSTAKVARVAEPYDEVARLDPPANGPDQLADLTDAERGLLVAMGLRWGYTPEDWSRLWADCQDPAKRAAWLATARLEAPSQDQDGAEDLEPSIVIRIEANIGTGRKVFDLGMPAHRWDEAAFAEQIAAMPGARWWRLGQPRTCASCRHQERTTHPSLVTCANPEGDHHYPAAGAHWDTDERMCRAWAPTSSTDINGQTADTEQE